MSEPTVESLSEELKRAYFYVDIMMHDINNANMAAEGFGELLGEMISEDDRVFYDKMMKGLRQSGSIIKKISKIREIFKSTDEPVPTLFSRSIEKACQHYSIKPEIAECSEYKDTMVIGGLFLDDLFEYLFENINVHCGSDASVWITCEENDGYIKVAISDNGKGVTDDKKKLLFRRFQEGVDSRRGKGLGLPACWLIAQKYGGDIWAEDRVAGEYEEGLKIVITLKLA